MQLGTKGFVLPVFRIDLCLGGTNLNCMRSPGDKDYWSMGIYREVFPPVLLVVTDFFSGEYGNVIPATYCGMSSDERGDQ